MLPNILVYKFYDFFFQFDQQNAIESRCRMIITSYFKVPGSSVIPDSELPVPQCKFRGSNVKRTKATVFQTI